MHQVFNTDIVVPEDFAEWKLSNPTPEQQVAYFNEHENTKMPVAMWNELYCQSIHHVGHCCSSCYEDDEMFDDICCCRGVK